MFPTQAVIQQQQQKQQRRQRGIQRNLCLVLFAEMLRVNLISVVQFASE